MTKRVPGSNSFVELVLWPNHALIGVQRFKLTKDGRVVWGRIIPIEQIVWC